MERAIRVIHEKYRAGRLGRPPRERESTRRQEMGEGRGGAHLANPAQLAYPAEPGTGGTWREWPRRTRMKLAHLVNPAHLAHLAAQGSP